MIEMTKYTFSWYEKITMCVDCPFYVDTEMTMDTCRLQDKVVHPYMSPEGNGCPMVIEKEG